MSAYLNFFLYNTKNKEWTFLFSQSRNSTLYRISNQPCPLFDYEKGCALTEELLSKLNMRFKLEEEYYLQQLTDIDKHLDFIKSCTGLSRDDFEDAYDEASMSRGEVDEEIQDLTFAKGLVDTLDLIHENLVDEGKFELWAGIEWDPTYEDEDEANKEESDQE